MKLKPYPEYKDSGVEWIGKIPKDWKIKKLKHLTQNLDGKRVPISAESRIPGNIPYYGATGIVDYVGDYLFNEELLLVGEDGAPFFEPYKDVSFIISGKSWVNNHAHVLKVLNTFNINLLMHSLNLADYSLYIKGSTRDKLNQDQLNIIPIIEPNEKEQLQITSFLDKKTSQIDKTIEKDIQLIELLKEKRTALINHAVTKGLDPDAKMKDSGVGWIGEIPEGWELTKIKFVSDRIVTGKTPPSDNFEYYNKEELNWFTPGDLTENFVLTESSKKVSNLALLDNKVIKYKPWSVLIVGIGATLGKLGILRDYACSNQQINAIEFDQKKIMPKYGLYYLVGVKNNIISFSNTSTIGIFNQTQTANFQMLKPPFKEQKNIICFIDNNLSKIDATIHKIERKIELLEEYKKSLIHHVVTGKVDVREEVVV